MITTVKIILCKHYYVYTDGVTLYKNIDPVTLYKNADDSVPLQ